MKFDIDKFVPRMILFAIINAVLIGFIFLVHTPKMPDYNVLYGTLASCVFACLFEPYRAINGDRRPDVGLFGASWFGAIIAGIISLLIVWM